MSLFCFFLTNMMYFGSYIIMVLAIALAIYLLVRSNMTKKKADAKSGESLFIQIHYPSIAHNKGSEYHLPASLKGRGEVSGGTICRSCAIKGTDPLMRHKLKEARHFLLQKIKSAVTVTHRDYYAVF